MCGKNTIGFGLDSHWLRKWHEFVNQSQLLVMQNQSKHEITLDTQLKTTLFIIVIYSMTYLGRCLLIQRYFCAVYDYAGKADLSKGY